MSLLVVRNLTKKFGSLIAVSNVSVSIEPGELRAVIGPNGAGKTTFFNMISGFFPPTTGEILVDDVPLSRLDAGEWRSRLAGAFQDFFRFEFRAGHTVGLLGRDGRGGARQLRGARQPSGVMSTNSGKTAWQEARAKWSTGSCRWHWPKADESQFCFRRRVRAGNTLGCQVRHLG